MKTLDQIWEENFDTIAPGEYTGSDCGNQIGGGAEDNQKDPLDTLMDKYKQLANDPAYSDAVKAAKMEKLLNDFFNPPKSNPLTYTPSYIDTNRPDPHYKIEPGRYRPEPVSTDPTSGPIPTYGIPEFNEIPIDLGAEITIEIGPNGETKVKARLITPSASTLIKAALTAAMAAKNAACAKKKAGSNGNINSETGDTATPTPTSTTPLVKPNPVPSDTGVPFRPIPPIRIRPGAGSLSGAPLT